MDPFATLGIEPAYMIDLAQLEKRHRELSRALHPDKYAGASASERRAALSRAADVNEAWRVVRDPIRRAEAILEHHGVPVGEDKEPKPDQELLMEMMEQREALAEARADKDQLAALIVALEARAAATERELGERLTERDHARALAKLGELRFVRRLLGEAHDAL